MRCGNRQTSSTPGFWNFSIWWTFAHNAAKKYTFRMENTDDFDWAFELLSTPRGGPTPRPPRSLIRRRMNRQRGKPYRSSTSSAKKSRKQYFISQFLPTSDRREIWPMRALQLASVEIQRMVEMKREKELSFIYLFFFWKQRWGAGVFGVASLCHK